MSNRRSIADFPRNEAGLVDEFIGTAYDTVKGVYDELPKIEELYAVKESIPGLGQAAVDTALEEAWPDTQARLDENISLSRDWADGVQPDPNDPSSKSSRQWSLEAKKFGARFLVPRDTPPTVRDDGSPLQDGDQYTHLSTNVSYVLVNGLWTGLNESLDNLIQDLKTTSDPNKAAGQVYVQVPYSGAVPRRSSDKMGLFICLEDFGAIGDGTYHPLSQRYDTLIQAQEDYPGVPITSLTQSIDWAATWAAFNFAGQKRIIVVVGVYVLNDTIEMDKPPCLIAPARKREWAHNTANTDPFSFTSAAFLSYGDFEKRYTVMGVGPGHTTGGTWENPDKAFVMDGQYSLANYYDDAGFPLKFSVLFKFKFGSNSANWKGITICKGFDGVNGYRNQVNGWGDNVDIGVYMDNSRHNTFEDVHIIGYWRRNGLLIRSGALDQEADYLNSGVFAGAEENKFYNCIFQGWKAVGNRSIDMYKVLEVGPDYIGIALNQGTPFQSYFRLRTGEFSGQFFTLTSVTHVGNITRLMTDGSPVGKVNVGDTVSPSYHGNGVAGTVFRDCRSRGMYHGSRRRCSDTWHLEPLAPSACLEISGTRIRGLRWETSKMQTVEDIHLHAHQTIDLMMPGLRLESDPDVNGIAGARMLSTNVDYPHYARSLFRVQLTVEQSGSDMRPAPSERPNKFPTEITGMWRPVLAGLDGRYGVFVGGFAGNNLIEYFNRAGFTVAASASDGDASMSGVVRHSTQMRINDMMTVQFSYYAGSPTYTTGAGQLRVSLPRAVAEFAGTLRLPIHAEGNLSRGKFFFLELTPGDTYAYLWMQGQTGGPEQVTPAKMYNSGTPMRISGTITYNCVK